jgi:hypothetical protein
MLQDPVNSNRPNDTLSTIVRTNDLRNNTKTSLTAMDAVVRPSPKCFRLFRPLFNNSVLVTALTIGLVFGLIQSKNLNPSYSVIHSVK